MPARRYDSSGTLMHTPARCDLFGVGVSVTDYAELEAWVMTRAAAGFPGTVAHLPVHGIVSAFLNGAFRRCMNTFDIVAADGQPVRWALNLFHGAGLSDRVYGPEFMLRLCARAAADNVGIYLYGSTPDVIDALKEKLRASVSGLRIAGAESPPFRDLSSGEEAAVVERIHASGAGIVFVGLGCPRQELFAARHRLTLHAVQVCVGAAFELHAGVKRMAPSWMQRTGLEWLFRFAQEPRRLWRRYLVTNTVFMMLVAREILLGRRPSARGG